MAPPVSGAALLALTDGPRLPLERASTVLAAAHGDDPSVWDDVPLGRRDAALLAVRRATLGRDLDSVVTCPVCGEVIDASVTTAGLLAVVDGTTTAQVTVAHGGYELVARPLTGADLAGVAGDDVDTVRAALVQACLLTASRDGVAITAADLPATVIAVLGTALDEADPLADPVLALRCPTCGTDVDASLDVAAFVWTELRRASEALLCEVDVLARRYGWSEEEILRLSSSRRQRYLDLG